MDDTREARCRTVNGLVERTLAPRTGRAEAGTASAFPLSPAYRNHPLLQARANHITGKLASDTTAQRKFLVSTAQRPACALKSLHHAPQHAQIHLYAL